MSGIGGRKGLSGGERQKEGVQDPRARKSLLTPACLCGITAFGGLHGYE